VVVRGDFVKRVQICRPAVVNRSSIVCQQQTGRRHRDGGSRRRRRGSRTTGLGAAATLSGRRDDHSGEGTQTVGDDIAVTTVPGTTAHPAGSFEQGMFSVSLNSVHRPNIPAE